MSEPRIYISTGQDNRRDKKKRERIKEDLVGPTTIALCKEGNVVKWGLSFCNPEDTHNAKIGNREAKRRMEEGFGAFTLTDTFMAKLATQNVSDADYCIQLVDEIRAKVEARRDNYRKRLTEFFAKSNQTSVGKSDSERNVFKKALEAVGMG